MMMLAKYNIPWELTQIDEIATVCFQRFLRKQAGVKASEHFCNMMYLKLITSITRNNMPSLFKHRQGEI
jgi:hypothetical protein